jgi:hypothetical protein
MLSMYILHKIWLLVSAITLHSIFDLFVVGGSSQAMACVYLSPPTQHQVKGLNQVDQDAHKLKRMKFRGTNNTYVVKYLVFITHITWFQCYSLYLVEKSSLWKVRIIPTKGSYITPTELLWSLLSTHNTNFSPIITNGYCNLLGPSRCKVSSIQNATYYFVSRLRKMSLLLASVWIKPNGRTTMMDKCRGCQNIILPAHIPN